MLKTVANPVTHLKGAAISQPPVSTEATWKCGHGVDRACDFFNGSQKSAFLCVNFQLWLHSPFSALCRPNKVRPGCQAATSVLRQMLLQGPWMRHGKVRRWQRLCVQSSEGGGGGSPADSRGQATLWPRALLLLGSQVIPYCPWKASAAPVLG